MTIDDAPLNSFHLRVVAYTTGGYFVDGYILGMIGIALALLAPRLGLGAVWTGLIGASALAGIFMEQFGTVPTMLGATAVLLLGLLLSVAWAPETRHVSLSEASMAGRQT
jgi:MFS transporter, putative metabolite transport protein